MTYSSPEGFITHTGRGRALPAAGGYLLAGADQTAGQFTLIESSVGQGDETPLHIHDHMDECFHVRTGQYEVTCGDQQFTAHPGDFVFLPRGIPHGYRAGPDGASKLILGLPAGLESFFDDMNNDLPWDELGRRHSITFL